MTKPKNLKDLETSNKIIIIEAVHKLQEHLSGEHIGKEFDLKLSNRKYYSEKDLKQMAIEWVKELKKGINNEKEEIMGKDFMLRNFIGQIKERFNLTEDDLK